MVHRPDSPELSEPRNKQTDQIGQRQGKGTRAMCPVQTLTGNGQFI